MVNCRFCKSALRHLFCDLGASPSANAYLERLDQKEKKFPLKVYVCHKCYLVQLENLCSPEELFSDYAYFSSYSASWVEHAKAFVQEAIRRFSLTKESFVVEVASNDGYLLQHFLPHAIPVLGIEPASNVACVAQEKGIETEVVFFGREYAKTIEGKADLLIGNNVFAHVTDLHDFVSGLQIALAPDGALSLEFPHLLCLLREAQFDTIYHEHFSYFSLLSTEKILQFHGLKIFDVEEMPTHGGSLRVMACHRASERFDEGASVERLRQKERLFGIEQLKTYESFGKKAEKIREALIAFLREQKEKNLRVAAYGAPAKGNTLLNFCNIGSDLISFTVDQSPHKQSRFLPGSHLPIFSPEKIREEKPDFLLILPWNLKEEVMEQMAYIRDWGAKFVIPAPSLQLL